MNPLGINDTTYSWEYLAQLGIEPTDGAIVIGTNKQPLAPQRYTAPIKAVIVRQDTSIGLCLGVSPTEKVLVYAEPGTEAPRYDHANEALLVRNAATILIPPRTNYAIESIGSVVGEVASTGVIFTEQGDINLRLQAPLEVITTTAPERRTLRDFGTPSTLDDITVYPTKVFAGTVYATSKQGAVAVQGYNHD